MAELIRIRGGELEGARGTVSEVALSVTPAANSTVPPESFKSARLWAVLTPRVPATSSVPVPLTDPALRFKVADVTSSVPEESSNRPGVVDNERRRH